MQGVVLKLLAVLGAVSRRHFSELPLFGARGAADFALGCRGAEPLDSTILWADAGRICRLARDIASLLTWMVGERDSSATGTFVDGLAQHHLPRQQAPHQEDGQWVCTMI